MIQAVPKKFQPIQSNTYPPDNLIDFEHWMATNLKASEITSDYVYLPICWTAYYVNANYGKVPIKMSELNRFLMTLDKTKKYFTVIQYDDGIISNIKSLDLKVFSMVDGTNDYPIPLLCAAHKWPKINYNRQIFANFVGALTHPIRTQMIKNIPINQNYFVSTKRHDLKAYGGILANSTFTLCPRGYGPTSFRIMEAIHQRSIPVYISDYFVEPYGIDFNTYGVKITPEQLPQMHEILLNVDVKQKKQALLEIEPVFTYEGCKYQILNEINNAGNR